MYCLKWVSLNGHTGYVVGTLDSLQQVYGAMKEKPDIMFSLVTVDTGLNVSVAWMDEELRQSEVCRHG